MDKPSNRDWVSSILEDMEDLEINLEREDIKNMPKVKLKEYIHEKTKEAASKYLLNRKSSRNFYIHFLDQRILSMGEKGNFFGL